MDTIISVVAFIGTVASFGSAIFVFISNLKTKKMQNINLKCHCFHKNVILL